MHFTKKKVYLVGLPLGIPGRASGQPRDWPASLSAGPGAGGGAAGSGPGRLRRRWRRDAARVRRPSEVPGARERREAQRRAVTKETRPSGLGAAAGRVVAGRTGSRTARPPRPPEPGRASEGVRDNGRALRAAPAERHAPLAARPSSAAALGKAGRCAEPPGGGGGKAARSRCRGL